jgi:hypothetical protein
MVAFYASLADRWFPWRWWFAAATAATFLLLSLLMLARPTSPWLLQAAMILSGPAITTAWGLLCMCVWFHPTRGNLMPGSWLGRLPAWISAIARGYFAFFLTIWFIFGVVVWPAFAILGARV